MPKSRTQFALRPDDLFWHCDPEIFAQFRDQPNSIPALLGQPRALEALRLGLEIPSPGYNIFVCGPSGTGKMSTVRALLEAEAHRRGALRDYCYVQNFDNPDQPILLCLPAGQARKFRRQMESFLENLHELIRNVLDSEAVDQVRRELLRSAEVLESELLEAFRDKCREHRFELAQVQIGEMHQIDVLPIYKRKPTDINELNEIARAGGRVPKLAETNRIYTQLKEELRAILVRLRAKGRQIRDQIIELEGQALRQTLHEPLSAIAEEFDHPSIAEWLERVMKWLIDILDMFREAEEQDGSALPLRALQVRVVLDNEGRVSPPIVFENHPTFINLLGTVERPSDESRPTSDFNDIKGGSLLRADGGYLVINANDAIQESGVWRSLVRALKTRELEIQSPEQFFTPGGGGHALKPEPIPLDVKVIAIGDDELYRMLYVSSEEFRRVFKIKADFDDVLARTDHSISIYARHVWRVIHEENLLPISDEALAGLVEYGVRLAGRQEWLSARFSDITDILRETCHQAKMEGATETDLRHLKRALRARRHRHSLVEDRLRSMVRSGIVNLITNGSEIGAANALTVLNLGDYAFGQPSRITATCAPGHDGLLSVEREVHLSGRLHNKGTMILAAYMRSHYLADNPMALSATVTFEQLHDEVDGDSASAAESLAILSALSRIPVDQGIAVTGAIDQRGQILAVGGLNEKIEGFFHLCAERGLTGHQGVALPRDNRCDLVLDDDVVTAVRDGRFHIWTVGHIDELIEICTGTRAGKRQADGSFPKGTLNALVQERLAELAEISGPHQA